MPTCCTRGLIVNVFIIGLVGLGIKQLDSTKRTEGSEISRIFNNA